MFCVKNLSGIFQSKCGIFPYIYIPFLQQHRNAFLFHFIPDTSGAPWSNLIKGGNLFTGGRLCTHLYFM